MFLSSGAGELFVGNLAGHFSKKENRIAKLILQWDMLRDKFTQMVEKGRGTTKAARHAYAVLVMMETGIRIGNEPSAEGFISENKHSPDYGKVVKTYGLTTLQCRHVYRKPDALILSFVGKKSVEQCLLVRNPVLLKYMPPITGDDDLFLGIEPYSLTRFIKRYVGRKFTPKDLRAAKVNLEFVSHLSRNPFLMEWDCATKSGKKKAIAGAIDRTAAHIGHTKGVCKKSYISACLLSSLYEMV